MSSSSTEEDGALTPRRRAATHLAAALGHLHLAEDELADLEADLEAVRLLSSAVAALVQVLQRRQKLAERGELG